MARKSTTQETTEMQTETVPTPVQGLSYGAFSTPVDSLPPAAVAYLLQYGFGKSLQDAASGVVKATQAIVVAGGEPLTVLQGEFPGVADEDLPRAAANAKMQARYEAILSGTVGTRMGTSGPKATSLDVEIGKVAREFLRKAAKTAGKTLPKADSDDYKALLERYSAKNSQVIKDEAERRMGSAQVEDLDDIFG
jgi:hypothetical protein